MIVLAKSRRGDMLMLAEKEGDEGKWYWLAEHTLKYAEKLNKGAVINVKTSEKNKKAMIDFIGFRPGEGAKSGYKGRTGAPSTYKSRTPYTPRSDEKQSSINRLSVLSSAAVLVASIKDLTQDNILTVTKEVYGELLALVEHKEPTKDVQQAPSDEQPF